MEQTNTVNLTDIIAPAFYPVHWDILDGKHTYYNLYGGRGSTKSSFISVEIVLGMMQDAKDEVFSNAVVFRKVGNTLRESVFEQIAWAIDALGANDLWAPSVSPMQYVYKPTGQKIISGGWTRRRKQSPLRPAEGILNTSGSRNLTSSPGLKKSVQYSSLFSVAVASL